MASSSSPSSAANSSSPCAACKFLRRKCTPECIFAPYFPPDNPKRFTDVHKIFGASNVTKLLNDLDPHQREDAVNSLAFEAAARVHDPVYGCVATISSLHRRVAELERELALAQSDLAHLASRTGSAMQQQLSLIQEGRGLEGASAMAGVPLRTFAGMQQHGIHSNRQSFSQQEMLIGARGPALEQVLEEIQRATMMSREELVEELTRAGRGSLESGLAVVARGYSNLIGSPNVSHGDTSRSSSEGGSKNMGHVSPP
ncbi:hypothetical protein KP509_01G082500 [Ceratopteris richardii]|uniref:LOB domain-containing protein n=1 Tax=Ceratopteris richardii TaxID=49495 RepID=A0A8T2VEQ6_CERRI|nr:hypothetical protein KP509_01G082500 [Ceratopteris richardii]KAH7446930.1 hypothetical protein KP509_01G082500 [Ceratopteris richardii]KAH7446931.1 hypothetical protein KP509_01G082500 [Ceratopteris richardii]